ncbi:DUF2491 family protein [Azospirillum sp.]|uniref:DUF2491 family protein n=1 Tax=Azospirillum sp. TaxID=34012 RepID=UPI003D71DA79
MRLWLTSALLGLSLAVQPGVLAPALLGAGVAVLADPAPAEARAPSSRSSGGYSRPSAPSRTPSFSVPSAPRAPAAGSGGYRRPSLSPSPTLRPSPSPSSPADRELSRRQSGEALERYRLDRQPPVATTRPVPPSSVPPSGARRHGQADQWAGYRNGGGWGGNWGGGWAPGRGWTPPGYAYNTPPRFGIWNGLFLWFLLDNLTRAGSVDFFHNHRDDPGYSEWRAEAERRAQGDSELRAKLDDLDAKLAEKRDQPRDPSYLPPDTPREVATGDTPPTTGSTGGIGTGLVLIVLLVGGGGAVLFWLARRRRAPLPAGAAPTPGPAGMAGRILRNAVSGERYTPSLFRVGMTLTTDPTPFILAGGAIKATAPGEGSGGTTSVEAVGRLQAGSTTLHRLYLPGRTGFFQLHLGADGRPDECRYFSALDEVTPAGSEEWAFWLDPAEGMIGWPEFQTKDGKLYARQWAPGSTRVAPRDLEETVTDTAGSRSRRLHAMLYAAPTGAAAPAPETEYILVSAVEDAGQAWVEVFAGIDANPATLSLA